MGQTSRFLDELHQEWDDLESSEKVIREMFTTMHSDETEVASVMNQFHVLCRHAREVCESVWLDFEPDRGKPESEVLVEINQHVSRILLCEWQKWLFKKQVK